MASKRPNPPPKPARVVVATGNRGKLRELAAALAPLGLRLTPQREFGVAPAPETGATFVENAIGKARHAAAQTGLPAIGDDSGLVVPALGGAPGVLSARYAGEDADDDANNAKLLAALGQDDDRSAHFCCVLALLRDASDPAPVIASGRWNGRIAKLPRGSNGFGYDPLFVASEEADASKTAAQLSVAEKNRRSHRGQACRRLAALLVSAS